MKIATGQVAIFSLALYSVPAYLDFSKLACHWYLPATAYSQGEEELLRWAFVVERGG